VDESDGLARCAIARELHILLVRDWNDRDNSIAYQNRTPHQPMNILFHIITIAGAVCAITRAPDLKSIKRTPARIEVINMQPTPLVAGTDKKGWAAVPAELTKHGALIYMPSGSTNGVADIKVTGDGFLMLAVNFDYQGNSGGKWRDEVWSEKKFATNGWHLLSETELGGVLVNGGNRAQVIFAKQLRKGETLRIRCNKYDPPYPLLLPAK
jgi:hypothetical protein